MTLRRTGMREFRKALSVEEVTEPLLLTRHKRDIALVLQLTSLPDVDGGKSRFANRQRNVAQVVDSFLLNEKALRRHIEEIIPALEARLRLIPFFAAELDRCRALISLETATRPHSDDSNPSPHCLNDPVAPK